MKKRSISMKNIFFSKFFLFLFLLLFFISFGFGYNSLWKSSPGNPEVFGHDSSDISDLESFSRSYVCSLLENSMCGFNDFNNICDASISSTDVFFHNSSQIEGIREYIYNFFIDNPFKCVRTDKTVYFGRESNLLSGQEFSNPTNFHYAAYGHSFDEVVEIKEKLNGIISDTLNNISFCSSFNTHSGPTDPGDFKGYKVGPNSEIPSSCYSENGCLITLIFGDKTNSNNWQITFLPEFNFKQSSDGSWKTLSGKEGINGDGNVEEIYKINGDLSLTDDCDDETSNSSSTFCLRDTSSSDYIGLVIC